MNNLDTIQTKEILINGQNVFYRFRPGTSSIYISFLHGYPTSSLDYAELFDQISNKYNIIAHDFLGFGHSDKPLGNDYLLSHQADITCALYKALGAKRVHIVAHDYGTSVATEIIVRHTCEQLDFDICSITLCNGSMLIDMAKLRLIQRLLKSQRFGSIVARLSSESTFQRNMRNIWFDKSLYPQEEMKAHWKLLISKNGKKVLPQITRYIDQRYRYYDRWIEGLRLSTLPFHILWAENDPVAIVDMAYKLETIIEDSTLTLINQCGHYPMIEQGEQWIGYVMDFIDDID